jgi:hypothetical protein
MKKCNGNKIFFFPYNSYSKYIFLYEIRAAKGKAVSNSEGFLTPYDNLL